MIEEMVVLGMNGEKLSELERFPILGQQVHAFEVYKLSLLSREELLSLIYFVGKSNQHVLEIISDDDLRMVYLERRAEILKDLARKRKAPSRVELKLARIGGSVIQSILYE